MTDTAKSSELSIKSLSIDERRTLYNQMLRQLLINRATAIVWASAEAALNPSQAATTRTVFIQELDKWAGGVLDATWTACEAPGDRQRPSLPPVSDSHAKTVAATQEDIDIPEGLVQTILLLHITDSKEYSARTRAFVTSIGVVDEDTIARTLKVSSKAMENSSDDSQVASATLAQAERNKMWRRIGVGVGAVAGGVLIGVTGGIAAPLVGAGLASVLGWAGVGGTAAAALASGLAGSSTVCGALFGAYGAKRSAEMVDRHTRDVKDFKFVPVHEPRETLAVRLCVSGWLANTSDVTAPWTIFEGDDTIALQWEVEALQKLSSSIMGLIKSRAMKYVKAQIIKRTIFASLWASLAPTAWLKLGQLIDNPWMNAKALAYKTGTVLGILLASRVFGARPITLTGYSLGSLVVLSALDYLATLPPSETAHLIQDVFLFGTPAAADEATWARARRVVAGRLVNGYTSAESDYVLAVVCRMTMPSAATGVGIAGLQPVSVDGVENVFCEDVEGHLKWRGMIGQCLQLCNAPGLNDAEVERQLNTVAVRIDQELEEAQRETLEDESDVMEAKEEGSPKVA